jgi:putative hydrolase of the HAD superfamily
VERSIQVVGLDADDTLWHSEVYFARAQRRFVDLVSRYVDPDVDVLAVLDDVELANRERYGYGFKGFTLSMVETAIEVTGGAISAEELGQVLAAGKAMLDHPVELIDGVDETVRILAAKGYRLVVVTKGDVHHQEAKLLASGLVDHFELIEIVAEKDPATYRRVVESLGVAPDRFCMVGNSVRSDVLPVLEIGGRAVHVPYPLVWAHEHAEHDGTVPELDSIAELPGWLAAQG